MPHKEPSEAYKVMLEIKYIVQSWQDLSYSDKSAIQKIETVILDYQKQVWKREHPDK